MGKEIYEIKGRFDSSMVEGWIWEGADAIASIYINSIGTPKERPLAEIEEEDSLVDWYYNEEHAFAIIAAYGWEEVLYGGSDPWEWFSGKVHEKAREILKDQGVNA